MSGRILSIVKDVWETLKKELGGPNIKKMEIDFEESRIQTKEINSKISINESVFSTENIIKDLKDETTPIINEAVKQSSVKKINTLKENFSLSEKDILLATVNLDVLNKKLEIDDYEIKKNMFKKFELEIKNIFLKHNTVKCYNSKKKIFTIPKKVFGKKVFELSKNELDELFIKMKKKFPTRNFSQYKIVSVFKKIPIESIKNIKYYRGQDILELYFNEKKSDQSCKFVVLENRFTHEIDKFFI